MNMAKEYSSIDFTNEKNTVITKEFGYTSWKVVQVIGEEIYATVESMTGYIGNSSENSSDCYEWLYNNGHITESDYETWFGDKMLAENQIKLPFHASKMADPLKDVAKYDDPEKFIHCRKADEIVANLLKDWWAVSCTYCGYKHDLRKHSILSMCRCHKCQKEL